MGRKKLHRMEGLNNSNNLQIGFPGDSVVKNLPANAGDVDLIPGSGRSPGVGNNNPFLYSCLENSMDRGAWRATAHGVEKSQTQLGTQVRTYAYPTHPSQQFLAYITFDFGEKVKKSTQVPSKTHNLNVKIKGHQVLLKDSVTAAVEPDCSR